MRSEISSSRVIAAIATPAGSGGIGIVRLSGAAVEVQSIAAGLMGALPVARRASRTVFRDAAGTAIDEGLAIYFPAPHSYTGEHVLELHGHGGSVVMSLLLARCVELGASLAEPGEFTRRAFLNEKLDLAQAEAVADLIAAQSSAAARSAIRSLRGEFSRAVRGLVDELVNLRMLIEATLDFPEEDLDSVDRAEICHRLDALEKAVDGVLDRARQGRLLRNGLQVVIAGQPNVGKSSLLNLLAQDEVAIVTPIAGTTRDTVRQSIQIEGIAMEVIDTAGLRETQDEVERIGIERAWREIERADLLMLVVDARVGVTAADEEIVARVPGSIPRLTVLNKCDLLPGKMEFKSSGDRVFVSAKTGGGLGALRDALLRMAGWHSNPEDVFIGRERHIDALRRAGLRLATAKDVQERMELCAEELRLAQEALTEITGEFTADDLLGEIFSRFCIGK